MCMKTLIDFSFSFSFSLSPMWVDEMSIGRRMISYSTLISLNRWTDSIIDLFRSIIDWWSFVEFYLPSRSTCKTFGNSISSRHFCTLENNEVCLGIDTRCIIAIFRSYSDLNKPTKREREKRKILTANK